MPRRAALIAAERLRQVSVSSARGAVRSVAEATCSGRRLAANGRFLSRADLAFYNRSDDAAGQAHGAEKSVTIPMNLSIKSAIADDALGTTKYSQVIYD